MEFNSSGVCDTQQVLTGIERLDPCVVTSEDVIVKAGLAHNDFCNFCNSRSFDMLNPLFLAQNPLLPFRRTILHRSQNNFGHLQSRVAESHYFPVRVYTKSKHNLLTIRHSCLSCGHSEQFHRKQKVRKRVELENVSDQKLVRG